MALSIFNFIFEIVISDDLSTTTIGIMENVTISFKHEYRRPNLTSRCDVMSDVNSANNTFSVRICDHLFISDVNLRLYWKIWHFQNWQNFEVLVKNFVKVSPEVEYTIEIAKSISYILSFDRCSSFKYQRIYGTFNILHTFQTCDLVIWLLT